MTSLKPSTLPLEERAQRLWPDAPALQVEWVRAVTLVRQTKRGWVADGRPALQKVPQ